MYIHAMSQYNAETNKRNQQTFWPLFAQTTTHKTNEPFALGSTFQARPPPTSS